MKFRKSAPLKGEITVPGDKSISHRSVMLGAISKGTTSITNFLEGADCLSTIDCFRKMGIEVERKPEEILIHGKGLHEIQRQHGRIHALEEAQGIRRTKQCQYPDGIDDFQACGHDLSSTCVPQGRKKER